MGRQLHFAAVVSVFYLSFFPPLSGRRLDVYHTSTQMHVWNVLHAARWKYTGRKNYAKKLPSAHHRTTLSTIGKKLVKWQYLLHMSLQYGELRPTNGWDLLASLGHPSKFQRVSRLGFVTAPTSLNVGQPNCTIFGRLLHWYTMYAFLGTVAP